MFVREDGSCAVADVARDAVDEYDDALCVIKFQGWTPDTPGDIMRRAEEIMGRKGGQEG